MKKYVLLVISCIAMMLLTSCGGKATKTTETTTVVKAEAQTHQAEQETEEKISAIHKEGLQMTIKPIHGIKAVKDLFVLDLVKRGYMPVHFSLTNISYEGEVICDPRNMTLISSSGHKYHTTPSEFIYQKYKRSYGEAIITGIMWPPAAIATAAGVAADNARMEKNVVDHALRQTTLLPGESIEGHVFFKIPTEHLNKLMTLNNWKVVAKVNNPDHKMIVFEQNLPSKFKYRGKKPLFLIKREMAKKSQ